MTKSEALEKLEELKDFAKETSWYYYGPCEKTYAIKDMNYIDELYSKIKEYIEHEEKSKL